MNGKTTRKWHVIGTAKVLNSSKWQEVSQELDRLSIPFQSIATTNVAAIQDEVDSLFARGADHFVSAGGDGAANLLVNALLNHDWDTPPTIGLLPFGTGCDFLRSVSIEQDPVAAVAHLSGEETRLCDVGVASGEWGQRHFINVASIGVSAHAARLAEKIRWARAARYVIAFWMSWLRFVPRPFSLETKDGLDQHVGMAALVANGKFFGSGFCVAPNASVDDGMADVVVFAAKRWRVPFVFSRIRSASHLGLPEIVFRRESEIAIACEPTTAVEVDGEYLGDGPVRFKMVPNAIRVKV